MVQQTDSKFSEYVMANSETGFTKQDKKTPVRDLPNENRNMVLKSEEMSKDNGPAVESSKLAGTKRSQQTPASNNGHLVYYVRRKTESEQHKNRASNKENDQCRKLDKHDEKNHEQRPTNDSNDEKNHEQRPTNDSNDEKNHEQRPINDSNTCIPEPKPSEGVSRKTDITSPTADSGNHQLNNAKGLSIQQWEERYFKLQNFLKALDSSNQDDYCQMLRSLSSVGLSRVAVELEKRTIQLSMEEAREVRRSKLVNALDIFPGSAVEHRSL